MNTITTSPVKNKKLINEINKNINYKTDKTRNILAQYAELTDYSIEDLTGKDRHADIMLIRKAIWLKMRKKGCTFKEIARVFHRTHPTIISGIYNIEGLLQIKDKQTLQELNKLNTNE